MFQKRNSAKLRNRPVCGAFKRLRFLGKGKGKQAERYILGNTNMHRSALSLMCCLVSHNKERKVQALYILVEGIIPQAPRKALQTL